MVDVRSGNGAVGWLANQTRPDLSAQVSLSQQGVPNVTGRHYGLCQQAIRRARQFGDLELMFQPIPLSELALCVHSDSAFERNDEAKPQYGFIVGFCQKLLGLNQESWWSPATWKSSRVRRACSSTLSAEGQAALDGARHVEWIGSLLCECLYSDFAIEEREPFLPQHMAAAITDCKPLYDHCSKEGGPATLADKSGALDVVVLRQTLARMKMPLTWGPTKVQLADSLTKPDADAMDYLRGVIRRGKYKLADEEETMCLRFAMRRRSVGFAEERR